MEEENDGSYLWDTWKTGSTHTGLIRIMVTDGDTTAEDRSDRTFTLLHDRSEIEVVHISGHGNGDIHIFVIDSTDFTGHTYQLRFADTNAQKAYHVYDEITEEFVIRNQSDMSGNVESPYFDGLRASIRDWPSIEVIDSQTGWTRGDCNWEFDVQAFQIYPSDYEIRFTIEGDTAIVNPIPVPFEVYSLTEQRRVDFIIQDNDWSEDWSSGDVIIFTEPYPTYTWRTTLTSPRRENPIDPEPGDVLTIIVSKPFTGQDVFRFQTDITEVDSDPVRYALPKTFALFQNYPNPFNTRTKIQYQIPAFEAHLFPKESHSHGGGTIFVTLKIFNILGQEVRILVNELKEPGYHVTSWDGKDTNGFNVSSGVYFYTFETNSCTQAKKMLILR